MLFNNNVKIEAIQKNKQTFKGIYNSNLLKKGFEFASSKGTLFSAGVSLTLSTVARPFVIMATPKTDKKNKQYACVKSISSSLINFGVMFGASVPLARAIDKIDANPQNYLKESTIKTLQNGEKILQKSKKYAFASQLFKLGLGFALAAPKSFLTGALIPPIMSKLFPNKAENKNFVNSQNKKQKEVSFTGKIPVENLSKGIGNVMNKNWFRLLTDKFYNTNFEMHLMMLTDVMATGAFMFSAKKSKKIDEDKKTPLIANAAIATGLSVLCGYTLDKLTEKPTQKFIDNFAKANANDPKLHKYIEGIKIAKAALLLGGIYYLVIPFISTFVSDKLVQKVEK